MQIHPIVPHHLIAITGLLDPEDCEKIIAGGERRDFRLPRVEGSPSILEFTDSALTRALWRRVRKAVPEVLGGWTPVGLSERFQMYRQGPGQQTKAHRDIPVKSGLSCSRLSLLCYLNEDFVGEGTRFRSCTVRPKVGMAVLFRHELARAEPSVCSGHKYTLRASVMYQPMPTIELPSGVGRIPPPRLVEGRHL